MTPPDPRPAVRLHADDFGATPATTRQVADLWEEGALDGFSVFANGAALDAAAARLAARPDLRAYVAVHLNLSEGPSAAPASEVPLLVDGEGRLRHSFGSLLATWLLSGRAARDAFAAQAGTEWRAQVRRVREAVAPRPVDAVDGHIHVHALPFLAAVAARVAREEGVPAIRVPREPFHVAAPADVVRPWFLRNVVKHVVLRGLSRGVARCAARESLRSPGRFVGVLYTGRMTEARLAAGVAAALRAGARDVEVAVHVGRPEPSERDRWRGRDAIWADAADPHRDVERGEVVRYARRLRQNT